MSPAPRSVTIRRVGYTAQTGLGPGYGLPSHIPRVSHGGVYRESWLIAAVQGITLCNS